MLLVTVCAFSQAPDDPAEQKKFDEAIDKSVEHYEQMLGLEDWQVFYADSILRHDYAAMRVELADLSRARVSNSDIYVQVQDKWQEKIYVAFKRILDESQWTKYLKSGAARDKKARDKRAEKFAGNE